MKEIRQAHMQSQPAVKWFKLADSRCGEQRGRTYGKCSKVREGVFWSSSYACRYSD